MPDTPPSTVPSSPSAPASASAKKALYVLDSHAIFTLLQEEEGHERVTALVGQAQSDEQPLYLSLINWGEIYYIIEREHGIKVTQELMQDLDKLPIVLTGVDQARVEAAAHIKAAYSVSYADAFAVALAQELGATVVTGDPEFNAVAKVVTILWLQKA